MAHNLTLTGATFDTSAQKFGAGALSGGYGTAAAVVSTFPYTIEAWVKNSTATGGPFIAAGIDNAGWIGVSAGKIAVGGTGSITTTLTDGAWHHLACVYTGTNAFTVYLDGVNIFTTTAGGTTPAPGTASTRVGNLVYGASSNTFQWPGEVDEVAFWSTAKYTAAFTPPSAAYVGTEAGLAALYHLDSNATDSVVPGLAIGSLSLTPSATGVTLTLSAAMSGGSGSGYTFAVYRGTDPNFAIGSTALLASGQTGTSYVDSTAAPVVQYYYAVIGTDSAGNTVAAVPAGINPISSSLTTALFASTALWSPYLAVVFIGDSITYSQGTANAGTCLSPTPEYFMLYRLHKLLGLRAGSGSNQGVAGKTTYDWAPGGTLYSAAKSAMQGLVTTNPGSLQLFNIMLGTNDSASVGTNNGSGGVVIAGSLSPANYKSNLTAIINQLLSDFPSCKVMIHHPTYYTPNTHNTATYEQAGLSVLASYNAQITSLVSGYASSNPGQVFEGDGYAYNYFAQYYSTEYQADTSGPNGTFYLHPNATGAQSLGEMWGTAWANALYGSGYGALPLATAVNPPDLVTLTQSGVAKQVPATVLKAYLLAGGS